VGAGVADGAADQLSLVAAEIVEQDDIADPQGRNKKLDDPGEEERSIDRAVDDAGSDDAVAAQPGQEGHGGPAAVRHMRDQTLTTRRPAMRAGHAGLGPGLVDEHQALGINPALVAPPACALAGDVGPLLFGGAQGFF
jgi:hypothetical protein